MSNALTIYQPQPPVMTLDEITGYAQLFAQSGYFVDAKMMAQAAVKIIFGAELGLKPAESVNGIFMISGKPSVGAGLLAKLVKASPKYDYKIIEMTDKVCSIQFYEDGKPLEPPSTFSAADAGKAGTKNMDKFPRNMLFARAISNGVRFHCPDVTAGPIYTPEELGAETDEEGNVTAAPQPKPRVTLTVTPTNVETVAQGNVSHVDQPSPDAQAFTAQLYKIMLDAWKAAKLSPTLHNVSAVLHISPTEAEQKYWNTKGIFRPERLDDVQLYRMAHYAKGGTALAEDAPIAEMLEDLKVKLSAELADGE